MRLVDQSQPFVINENACIHENVCISQIIGIISQTVGTEYRHSCGFKKITNKEPL